LQKKNVTSELKMYMIIDANAASFVFSNPCHKDYEPIFEWIDKKDGKIVYGGRNAFELFKISDARRSIINLDKAGQAWLIEDRLDSIELSVINSGQCKSNDSHVIALARRSGARILCLKQDDELEEDFKNLDLLPFKKGKIYKRYEHRDKILMKDPLYHAKPCFEMGGKEGNSLF